MWNVSFQEVFNNNEDSNYKYTERENENIYKKHSRALDTKT
jgi:hypothetical protein